MRGNKTSLKMAVHSWWSAEAREGESKEFWRQERAWWRISRQGLRHWERRASKIGDQYVRHAGGKSVLRAQWERHHRTFVTFEVRLIDEGRDSVGQLVYHDYSPEAAIDYFVLADYVSK